jgi:hypothetical protein
VIENGRPDGSFLLHYGGLSIPFQVQFRERKRLAITVHPEMKLEVSAPQGAPLDQVLARESTLTNSWLELLLLKAMLYNYEAETQQAYRVLEEMRAATTKPSRKLRADSIRNRELLIEAAMSVSLSFWSSTS